MLVTACPHCGAQFRATSDQLNLRQGLVRCGQCQGTFNAFETLVREPRAQPQTLEDILHPSSPAPARSEEASPEPPGESMGESAQATGDEAREDPPPAEAEAAKPEPDLAAALPPPHPAARARPARAWLLGAVLLALVLALQVAYAYRAQLARNYPMLRPALEAACQAAGCRVPWVNDESALKLEDSEMLEVPGKPGQIALQARIRNLSPSAQEFPHLELTLTDLTGQAAIRRVLRPADYLGRDASSGHIMAAGSEALLNVRLETGRIRATGYELLLFYP